MDTRTVTLPLIRVADLDAGRSHDVQITLDATALEQGREQLDILGLAKVRLEGRLSPERRTDWRLKGKIGATVTQACVVSLDPVRTRVETPVERLFTVHFQEPDPETETEIPEDVNVDPLGAEIDLAQLIFEEISLAMPDYPRAEGIDPLDAASAPEGIEPLTDEDLKPFAALKALKEQMEK